MAEVTEESDRRSKRQKFDKNGRFAALKRLKDLKEKGIKHKYEVDDVDNVYDTVDEEEYSRRVTERQNDDWIVGEGANDYLEDGRDIFDDDLDSESIAKAQKEQRRGKKRKKGLADTKAPKGNIQLMLSNIQSKKKEEVKLDGDDDLSDLISELNDETGQSSIQQAQNTSTFLKEKLAAKSYMNTFSSPRPALKIQKIHSKVIELARNTNKNIVDESLEESVHETDLKDNLLVLDRTATSFVNDIDEPATSSVNCVDEPSIITSETNLQQQAANDVGELNDSDDFDISQISIDNLQSSSVIDKSVQLNDEVQKASNEDMKSMEEDMFMNLDNGWETMLESYGTCVDTTKDSVDKAINIDDSCIDKDNFLFYWWDVYENRAARPGVVLLFGKTYSEEEKAYISCCVVVENIERQIFLLPRTHHIRTQLPVTIKDVYEEFNDKYANHMDSFKAKKVKKKYVFDPHVPTESDYLEIRYAAKYLPLSDKPDADTFSTVFGTTSSFLELLLLDRKIKGPCWLSVTNAIKVSSPFSRCKCEMICSSPTDLAVIKDAKNLIIPPLTVMAINVKTVVNAKTKMNEIVMIGCLTQDKFYVNKPPPNPPFNKHFCVMRALPNKPFPVDYYQCLLNYKGTTVQKADTERALINRLLNEIEAVDPDLIVGHDLHGDTVNLFITRTTQCSADPSRFGRVKHSKTKIGDLKNSLFLGRLVCDLKISLKELIKLRSFDMDTLCTEVLKVPAGQRIDIDPEDLPRIYDSSADIFSLVSCTMQDTAFILKMMYDVNVIPLALQITQIAGNVLSRTLLGGRSERNEFLLMHAFHERDHIVPPKAVDNRQNRKGATYSGGLVLDPKIGFYDKMVLLMDFNSLYPSIIQEYNICFTTQNHLSTTEKYETQGILPTEIRKLVESRREVKKLMNAPDLSADLKLQYNIRQMALKLTANSMYGCLGYFKSRFYAKNLAEYVTEKGREILMTSRDLVQAMSYEVIYGDTDSIMINTRSTDYDAVMKIGYKIKQAINKSYKQIELDIDGVFKYLLLLKKKKYAAVTLTKSLNGTLTANHEYKGLDFVRRDWCPLTAVAGKRVLGNILSDAPHDDKLATIKTHLEKLKNDLHENGVPLPLLTITKQLTKDPDRYADANSLPHVRVAIRYNERNSGKRLRAGDVVRYVICDDGSNRSATQRAFHVDEFKKSKMKLDVDYYLSQQVHPVVARLCEPIEGIDSYEIGEALGIERLFKKMQITDNGFAATEAHKEKHGESFTFTCVACKTINSVADTNRAPFLIECSNVKCNVWPVNYLGSIKRDLMLYLRKRVTDLYQVEFVCEDPTCRHSSTGVLMRIHRGRRPVCEVCGELGMFKGYSPRDFYRQLIFLRHLFDINSYQKNVVDPTVISGFQSLVECINDWLSVSAYANIDFRYEFNLIYYGKRDDDDCKFRSHADDDDDDDQNEELE